MACVLITQYVDIADNILINKKKAKKKNNVTHHDDKLVTEIKYRQNFSHVLLKIIKKNARLLARQIGQLFSALNIAN